MLILEAERDTLLKPLQAVTGIVERKHTLPILSNVLIERTGGQTNILATDLEIKIHTHGPHKTSASPPMPKNCKTSCAPCLKVQLWRWIGRKTASPSRPANPALPCKPCRPKISR